MAACRPRFPDGFCLAPAVLRWLPTTETCMRHLTIPCLLAAAVLLGAAGLDPAGRAMAETMLPDFNSFVMMRGSTAISVDQAADVLKDFDVVFVGELHDHIANHLAEMALLRAIQQRVPHLALSMEQFERDR